MTTDHDHDKYITTQEFNKLSAKNFTARLAEANLVSINDFANLINEINFDNKLKILNKNVTSKKIELNELSENVKAISTIGLTKDLINQFSILHVAKNFSSGIFQNYLVFILVKKHITYFSGTTWIDLWKSNGECQKKIFKL